MGFDEGLLEVHEDESVVDLDHAVLEAAVDAQLLALRLQADRRLVLERNRHLVELHQRLQHRGADRRGAGEADETRDVDAVLDREVALRKRDAVGLAVLEEPLGDGLQEADAAVVSVEPEVAGHLVQRREHRIVDLALLESDAGRLGHHEFHAKLRERE